MSVAVSAGRRPGDPVLIGGGTGWLNGGADVLTPRAGFYALQAAFKGPAPSTESGIVGAKLTPISLAPRAGAR
jgi:hypothetical protein